MASKFKGKTWEEIYGKQKANYLKNNQAKYRKNKSHKEIFGKEKAKILSKKQKERLKGKTWEEIYGKQKAIKMKINHSKKTKGIKLKDRCNKNHINKLKKYGTSGWSKEKIIKKYIKITNIFGKIKKSQLDYFSKKYNFPSPRIIRLRFGSLNKLAEKANIPFIFPTKIGNNEKIILDKIEEEKNIIIRRSKIIYDNNSFIIVDGYDEKNNIVYEIDEKYHKYNKIKDKIREKRIKNILDCQIIRIKEEEYLKKLF